LTTSTKRMETILDLAMGKLQTAANLIMVPLSGNPAAGLDYLLVDEALRKKEVVVEEVSEGGTVPEIRVTNFSKEAVLVVDGTESPRSRSRRSRSPAWSRGDGTIGGGTSSPARTTPVKGQTGAAFLVGDTFAGLDLFDRPATLKALFPKLLSAVAMEAMMSGPGGKGESKTDRSPEEKVRKVLVEIARSLFEKFDPVGVGEDWRYEGKLSLGKALYFEGDLIHFSAFGK